MWGRACFEVLLQQGLCNAEVVLCLGRSRVTVWWEQKRFVQGAYHAETAQNGADGKALRPRLCELVVDGELV